MKNFGAKITANQLATIAANVAIIIVFSFVYFEIFGFSNFDCQCRGISMYDGFVGCFTGIAFPYSHSTTLGFGFQRWVMALEMKECFTGFALNG